MISQDFQEVLCKDLYQIGTCIFYAPEHYKSLAHVEMVFITAAVVPNRVSSISGEPQQESLLPRLQLDKKNITTQNLYITYLSAMFWNLYAI